MFKGILKYFLFLFFFIGDIAFIFSDKGLEDKSKYESFPLPISYRINNEYSSDNAFYAADSIFTRFLLKYKIKGASLAIAKDGKLIMAKGYGYANYENEEPVEPRHLFRIASVSKLYTAVAIMKLQEEGKIDVKDKVFGREGILNDTIYDLKIIDKRVYDITVHNLLNHTAGWSKKGPDPMFSYFYIARELKKSLPLSINDIIVYAISRKLDFTPGSTSSYSNLGYAILGKVIEKVSGLSYEEYVKTKILFPIEIYDMHIARSFYYQKFTNEVSYYEAEDSRQIRSFDGSGSYVPKAYGNDMELLSAAGGWLASPSELMKFILAIDGLDTRSDILSKESIDIMVNNQVYGVPYGWKGANNGFWWRTGTLTGTSALIARQNNGICWIALFNTSPKRATRFPRYVHQTMNKVLGSIDEWPDHDLFQYDVKRNNSLFAVN